MASRLNRTWHRLRGAMTPSPRQPRRALMEQLEQRVLLSAEIDMPVVTPMPEALATTANVYPPESSPVTATTAAVRHEIVFVDTSTPDYQKLVDDLLGQNGDQDRQFELVLLDGSQDGVARITEALSSHHDLSAIHLIAHGGDGVLQLGATTLDSTYLQQRGDLLAAWAGALNSDADILIYGCDVAATGNGQAFINELARLTGADVAASDDLTGSSTFGGDWTLEQSAGHIEASVAISAQAQAQWQGLLTMIAYDDFTHNGNLNNDNGGAGWATNWSADGKFRVDGGGLSDPDGLMAPSGDSVVFDTGDNFASVSATRNLSTTLGADGTTTWLSFLLKPDNVSGVSYMGIEFGGGSGGTTQFAGYQAGSFILNNAGGGGTVTVPGITPVSGQTYLMVVRIQHTAGNDTVTLYVNPTPGRDAPDSAFTVSKSVNVGNFTRIGIGAGQLLSINRAEVDQLRVGTTFNDVANSLVVTTSADNNDSGIVAGNGAHDIQWLIANRGGDGEISLREAMIAANNTTGADTITFNIPGSTAHTITLNSALPAISDTVTIDGSSQLGYIDNGSMPVVVIDGNNGAIDGLRIDNTADGSTINGLALRNVRGNEIVVTIGADNNTISNNFIGALDSSGNYSAEGTSNTGYGMWVNGADNLIANNVFAGNYRAIMIDGATAGSNRIQGNKIGTNAAGTTGIGHGGGGIVVQGGATGTIIGTDLDGSNDDNEGNLIAFNSAAAISISNDASNSVRILGNSIHGNSGLGIDLKADGTSNANDSGDADSGPNGMLNFPVVYSAVVSGGNVTITGEARPGAVVEFFIADAAAGAYGEGQTFIGRGTVAASGTAGDIDGTAVFFSFTFAAGSVSTGDRITATATVAGATSEFAQNIVSTAANTAPTLSVIGSQTIDEDSSTGAIAFTIDDVETAAAGLLVTATSGNQTIIPNANITLGGSGANRTITVTPAANRNGGPVTITVEVSDGTHTTQRTFTVTVNAVNDAPSPIDDSYLVTEGSSLTVPQGTGLLANDTDVEGDALSVLSVTQPSHGTLSVGANGSFTYTPAAGFSGTDSFQYLLREAADGTTHYWGMGGNLVDSIGSSDGTTHNTTTTAGVFGSALQFNGTTSYGTLPDISYSNDFTLSLWFRTPSNAGTGYQYLYAHGTPGTQNSLGVYFIEDSTTTASGAQNVLRTRITDSNDADNLNGLDLDVTALGLADNSWHQYTLTVENGVGSTVYIDGVALASISNGGNPLNPSGSVMIGALTAGDATRMFTGSLDGLQLFNTALNASEVSTLLDTPNQIGTVTIHVNDQPVVAANTGMGLLQGATRVITSGMLAVTDGDNTASELVYTLSSAVSHGRLELSTAAGVAISGFTQADVDAGLVRYVHDGTATTSDSFTFAVADGDGGSTGATTFAIAITSSNSAPTFTSTAVTAATEDSAYSYSITTSDADVGNTLTITAPTLPAWLTLTDNGNGTATLTGTPTNAQVGTHSVVLQVSDGIVNVTQSFTITVTNTNDAPAFTSTTVTAATEDSAYSYAITTSDVDVGDVRTITAPTLPAWLTLTDNGNGTATLTGTPTNAHVGTHSVVLQVSDGTVNVTQSFTITVTNTNDAPAFTSTAVTAATEDSAYSYSITTSDADVGNTLTITAPTLPAWLTLTDNGNGTATLTGTPTNTQVGTHSVVLQVSDGTVNVTQSFTITVANTNDAPAFTSTAVTAATEDSAYSYAITTSDVDVGDVRTITAPTLPAWLTLTDNGNGTATLTGTPTNAQVGTHSVVLQVSDGTVNVTQSFTITVTNANDAPAFTSTAVTAATEDSAYSYSITTTDADVGNTLTITAPTLPAWLTLTDNGNGTATLTGTPTNAQVGTHSVVLQVSDGTATTSQTFTITVTNTNDAPVFTSTAVTAATEDSAYSYAITTSDVDVGDVRTITAPTLPAWLTLTDNGNGTATLTGTPTNAQVGTHSVVLQVSDGTTTVNQTFSITVSNVNDAPTLTAIVNQTISEDGATAALPFTISDVDSAIGTLTVTATSSDPNRIPNANLVLGGSGANRTITITPAANANGGPVTVTISVSDGSASNATTFLVTINAVNDTPVLQRSEVLRLEQNDTATINASTLRVTDIDSSAANLRFTITRMPIEGTLLRDGVALVLGDSFTQADINSGRISYAHGGGATSGVDVVEFSVSDGAGGAVPLVSLLMDISTITPPDAGAGTGAGGASSPTDAAGGGSHASSTDNPVSEEEPATTTTTDETDTGAAQMQATPATGPAADAGNSNSNNNPALSSRFSADADRSSAHRGGSGGNGGGRATGHGAMIQQDLAPADAIARSHQNDSEPVNIYRVALNALPFRNGIDEVREQFRDRYGDEQTVVASSIAMSTGMSIGYVIWLLRGGVLLGSVLSSLPAWRLLDPTPVLSGALARGTGNDEEDDSLEEMLRRADERNHREQATGHAGGGRAGSGASAASVAEPKSAAPGADTSDDPGPRR